MSKKTQKTSKGGGQTNIVRIPCSRLNITLSGRASAHSSPDLWPQGDPARGLDVACRPSSFWLSPTSSNRMLSFHQNALINALPAAGRVGGVYHDRPRSPKVNHMYTLPTGLRKCTEGSSHQRHVQNQPCMSVGLRWVSERGYITHATSHEINTWVSHSKTVWLGYSSLMVDIV